jgi:methyltransferase
MVTEPTSVWLYVAFIAAIGLERLGELALSRRNARLAVERGGFEVASGHYRAMAALHTLFLVACPAEVILLGRGFPGAAGYAALGLAACAQGLRYWAIATLGRRWNVRVVVVPGEAPVTGGPYRFLRHPNYLAVVLEMVAIPMVHGAWLTALVFSVGNALVLRVRIRAEEKALGEAYARAFAGTPRFVPEVGRG